MATKRKTAKEYQQQVLTVARSLPLVGRVFDDHELEVNKKIRRLEYENGRYRNALATSMRAINQTVGAMEQLVRELESSRDEIRQLLMTREESALGEQSLGTSA
jgi:chromosome condensin MukBEF complex kleisin-like MukF subunit